MKRETTNFIRFVIEELIPPFIKDSRLFYLLAKLAYGSHFKQLTQFRQKSWNLSPSDYSNLYESHPRVHALTDNSKKCIDIVLSNIIGTSVLDVGCGSGYLINMLKNKNPHLQCEGFDVTPVNILKDINPQISFNYGLVECLPYPSASFDTVICTHVLEHVLDLNSSLRELRRVASQRLIVVVPKEREYMYAFNPHLHFFPYPHSLLRAFSACDQTFELKQVGRDYVFVENIVARQNALSSH